MAHYCSEPTEKKINTTLSKLYFPMNRQGKVPNFLLSPSYHKETYIPVAEMPLIITLFSTETRPFNNR